jgi:hypothetical protein
VALRSITRQAIVSSGDSASLLLVLTTVVWMTTVMASGLVSDGHHGFGASDWVCQILCVTGRDGVHQMWSAIRSP